MRGFLDERAKNNTAIWPHRQCAGSVGSINQGDNHEVPQSVNTKIPRNGLLAKLVITNPSAFNKKIVRTCIATLFSFN